MKINNPLIRKIGSAALGVLLLIYIGYQVFLINYHGLTTETAMYYELSDTIEAEGWAVRNEEILSNSESGVLDYNVSDGEKVAKGNTVADVYVDDDSANSKSRIARLDTEIANLEMLQNAGDVYSSSAELIGTQINESLGDILTLAQNNEYQNVYSEREHLQHLLNQKRVIVGKESPESFQPHIDGLKAEREAIAASATGRIGFVQAPASGYFISHPDGYEQAFDIEKILNITVTDIQQVKQSAVPASAIGKISKDFTWYMVCAIDEQQKIKLEGVTQVKLQIPLVTAEQIPANVLKINQDEKTGKYAVVLSCDYMNAELAAVRNETIQIVAADYAGVLVNQKAIAFNTVTRETTDPKGNKIQTVHENVKGVYVKYGERINFVQIFTDVTINGYAVCKLNLSESEQELLVTDSTIRLYDEVVIGGTNLYDGKLL